MCLTCISWCTEIPLMIHRDRTIKLYLCKIWIKMIRQHMYVCISSNIPHIHDCGKTHRHTHARGHCLTCSFAGDCGHCEYCYCEEYEEWPDIRSVWYHSGLAYIASNLGRWICADDKSCRQFVAQWGATTPLYPYFPAQVLHCLIVRDWATEQKTSIAVGMIYRTDRCLNML